MPRWASDVRAETASVLRGVYLYTPFDQGFVDELKALVPHDLRVWERDDKRWYVFETYAERAVKLARSYWPYIDLSQYTSPDAGPSQQSRQRQQDQGNYQYGFPGGQGQRQQSSGYQQTSWGSAASSDHSTLYVTADAPREVVAAAYKALMKLHHPDTGGDKAKAQAINVAYERLKKAGKA